MKKAYITGATGAIGMALVDKLLKENVEVTVFVRPDSKRLHQFDKFILDRYKECQDNKDNEGTAFDKSSMNSLLKVEKLALNEFLDYDVTGEKFTKCCSIDSTHQNNLQKSDSDNNIVFYHLAWEGTIGDGRNDVVLQQRNKEYTLHAVRLAKRLGCDVFIGAGSQAEYGRVSGVLKPDTDTKPENEYGKAKLEAGILSRQQCKELGMRHFWVRILSVYGPYDGECTMVMSMLNKLINNEEMPLTEGIQTWDYLNSEDAARALYLIGNIKNVSEAVYCLGSGVERPLKEYIYDICDAAGADRKLLKFGAVPYGDKQVMRLVADISKLTEDTGFVPEVTFVDGIRKLVKHLKEKRQ